MPRLLAIHGSYREGGVTDQLVAAVAGAARSDGAEVEVVALRDLEIGFCSNCRQCMQVAGEQLGECVQQDDMRGLVERIEAADGLLLATPTNVGSATALWKRFMERLGVYAYWPWGAPAPKFRKASAAKKPALLLSSCAAPGPFGRWLYATSGQLDRCAKIIGAKRVGTWVRGLCAQQPQPVPSERDLRKAGRLARRWLRAVR